MSNWQQAYAHNDILVWRDMADRFAYAIAGKDRNKEETVGDWGADESPAIRLTPRAISDPQPAPVQAPVSAHSPTAARGQSAFGSENGSQ